jgi:uncharacterized protein
MKQGHELITAHFEELDQLLRRHVAGVGLPEIHGMACGLLCAGHRTSRTGDWRILVGDAIADESVRSVLDSVFNLAQKTLDSPELDFSPLLPADDVPITLRVESVSDWCSGFMQAFVSTGPGSGESETAQASSEAVEDIMAIAGVVPDDSGDEEAQKRNLMRIEEHLRIATQLIFDQLPTANPPNIQPGLH